jgi:hypothetical protein
MSQESRIRPIPKILAFLIVSVFAAWYLHRSDLAALARMDNMTPDQYVAHQRAIHLHHVVTHFAAAVILGAVYLGVIEILAYLFRSLSKNTTPNQSTDPTPASVTPVAGQPPRQP